MTAKRKPLADYAKDNPPNQSGHLPWLRTIPEHDEVVAAYKAGTSPVVIFRWLRDECGYGDKVTRNKVDRYLNEHHSGTKAAR